MSPSPILVPDPERAPATPQERPRQYTPGFSDGLGDRLLLFDTSTASSLELLRFKKEFSEAAGFEAALRKRIDELSHLRHPSIATVRTVERVGTGDGLALVSVHTAGRRLSEMIQAARGAPFALDLIQQIGPALAALQQQSWGITHGVLTAERIVVTREGRLILVEHVLGAALESLRLPASRLRTELGLAVPTGAELVQFDSRTDVIQLGFIALSLVLGRRLAATDYPANITALLDEFARADAAASAKLRPWLERALQVGKRPFESAHEAHDAFSELAGQLQPQAADSQRGVLAFHAPAPAAPAASDKKAAATAKADTKKQDEKKSGTPRIFNRAALLIKVGVGALALLVVVEALIIAGLFSFKPTLIVATPPPKTDPAGPLPVSPIATSTPGTIILPENSAQRPPAAEPAPAAAAAAPEPPPAPAAPAVTGRFGGIQVTAPIELHVFESEKLLGSTAGPIAIVDGPHSLDLVNEELGFRVRQNVTVKAGQMLPIRVSVPNGRISINAVPWADVFIDGNAAGQTPLANLSLPIGKHEIVFRHPQLGSQTQIAVVKVDGLTRLAVTFQQ